MHLARHALLKRPTAIKILKRHHATDELSARFEREVRLVSELRHPNTIEIYDYGHTADGLLYYAMEFVDGLTLEALIARERTLPLQRMRHIVLQVCAALAEVHAKGMIHRDIKPENVMVCERGGEYDFVKLLDFGIVKRIEVAPDAHPNESRALTRQVRLLGTPAYMAPERIGAPSGVDARADIYGVGALIFFLVAGRPPFEGTDEAALLRQVLADPVATARRPRARRAGPARRSRRTLPREGAGGATRRRRGHRHGAGVLASAAVDARRRAQLVGPVARSDPQAPAERRRLGQHVRIELPLQQRDLVLEQQLAALQSPQLQFVVHRILGQTRDRHIEIAMLDLQLDQPLLERNAGRVADAAVHVAIVSVVVVVVQSVPTAAASSMSGRLRP